MSAVGGHFEEIPITYDNDDAYIYSYMPWINGSLI